MSGRRLEDQPTITTGLGADLLKQVMDRPPAADIREAHELAALEAQAEAERARAGFYSTLHVLALEARAFLALEREKRFGAVKPGKDRRR